MKKKNVLIVSYSYPPSNSPGVQRSYSIAKYLNKDKYNVTVITCKNPKTPLGIDENFNPELKGVKLIKIESFLKNTNINKNVPAKQGASKQSFSSKMKSWIIKISRPLIFPDFGITWTPNVKKHLRNNSSIITDSDIIITSSPGISNHQIGRFIKKRNSNIFWISDFRDFHYPNNIVKRKGIIPYMHKRLERGIINKSNRLTYVTQSMLKAYQEFYPLHKDKMHCIYNGYDKDDFNDFKIANLESSELSIFYAGSFYNGLRSPLPLMQLLDKALDEKIIKPDNVKVKIAGSIEQHVIEEMSKYNSFKLINFLGNIPRTDALKEMTNAAFLWLIVADIPSHYQTVPAKIFEYMAARRPILNFSIEESETFQIVKNLDLGESFATGPFELNREYSKFKNLILKFQAGEYKAPLSLYKSSGFLREEQAKDFESLTNQYE